MLRVAAAADLHCRPGKEERVNAMLCQVAEQADLLLLAGDLTDTGMPAEANVLVEVLSACPIPIVAVLGNHDFHHHQQADLQQVLSRRGVTLLDGDGWTFEHAGVRLGVAGAVGFGGGFRPYHLTAFGEEEWKTLHEKTTTECRKLDRALSAVRGADYVIAMLHYSPTVTTMGDEPAALYPYLGSSELGDTLERHAVHFAVHGHAHLGQPKGQTAGGVAVYNVALSVIIEPRVWKLAPRVSPDA